MRQPVDRLDDFWVCMDELVRSCRIVVDRPKGTAHPRYPEYIYPVDYRYLEGTTAADGHGIDIWVGTLEPKGMVGILCIVDMVKRDSEIKIRYACSPEETDRAYRGQNSAVFPQLRPECGTAAYERHVGQPPPADRNTPALLKKCVARALLPANLASGPALEGGRVA